MGTRTLVLTAALAAALSCLTAACSSDAPHGDARLQFVPKPGEDPELDSERTMLATDVCFDGTSKPIQRVELQNPGSESVMFTTRAGGTFVLPPAATVDPGQKLALTIELLPFVKNVTPEHTVFVQRSDGEEMLSIHLEPRVDPRLLDITANAWLDESTFVVSITNPTGWTARDIDFRVDDDQLGTLALDELGSGETKVAIVRDTKGNPPRVGATVRLSGRCSTVARRESELVVPEK